MSEKYLPLSGIKSILRECLPEDELFQMTELISAVSPADVVPVVHGRWVWKHKLETYECSVCGGEVLCDDWGSEQLSDYCPHCGAKMDESEGEEGV